jgi:DNA-binding IclR family transcriptional regulator
MNSLFEQSCVVQNDETKRYSMGPAVLQMGLAMLARLEVRQVARPYLEALAQDTGETAFLGIRNSEKILYIDKALPESAIRMDAPLGVSRPYNCTAVGKVILAHLPAAEFERLANTEGFVQLTPHSITDSTRLSVELETIRQNGYALDREEFRVGAACVAAPIYDHDGKITAAITVAGPADRIQAQLESIVERVLANSREISARMGYDGHHATFKAA